MDYTLIVLDTELNTVEFCSLTERRRVHKKDAARLGLTLGLLKAGGWHGKQVGALVYFTRRQEQMVTAKEAVTGKAA